MTGAAAFAGLLRLLHALQPLRLLPLLLLLCPLLVVQPLRLARALRHLLFLRLVLPLLFLMSWKTSGGILRIPQLSCFWPLALRCGEARLQPTTAQWP